MNKKRSATQEAYGGLIQYRAEGTWLGRDIPELIPYSLRIQEESGETKIKFLVPYNEAADIASGGQEAFLSEAPRYAYWHTYWTMWMDQESNAPWLELWIQEVAAQLTPALPQLHAKLFVFFILTTRSDILISRHDESPVIL